MQKEESLALSCQQFELITESNIKINGLSNINESLSIHYLIYKIDNLKNGKYYIGQHHTENPLDNYMGSGNLIFKAVAKYGVESFVKTILFDFNNFEEMDEKEKELVPLSACYPYDPTSYNLKEGGSNGEMSTETRLKISDKLKGRKLTLEQRQHMCQPRTKEQRQHMCQPRTKEHRQHIKNGLLARTKEQKKETSEKLSNAWKNKSKEQQAEIIRKVTESNWYSKTDEEKNEIIQKRITSWNNKPIEQKLASLKKRTITYNSMSKERKEQISLHKSLAWEQKPLNEKIERNTKISSFYQNATKEYKEQRAQKISIGVSKLKWFTDITTGKHYRLTNSSNPNLVRGRLTKEQIAKLVDVIKKPIEDQASKKDKEAK